MNIDWTNPNPDEVEAQHACLLVRPWRFVALSSGRIAVLTGFNPPQLHTIVAPADLPELISAFGRERHAASSRPAPPTLEAQELDLLLDFSKLKL